MANIEVLDQITIDKIAAGEVVERPASIVKELVENAIDASASAVTVEIKEGGISFIRITDNGCGINRLEVPLAFLRHSTSKIRHIDDLVHVSSLGFRGEALSSIAAISQVELITKTKEDVTGSKYVIEGGIEKSMDEIGAPEGTTFLIHQIFYNTPARRKFLKTPMTEASHVSELMTRLALSHPEVSFQFVNNGQTKIHTSGNGILKDVIYHVFGREIANNLIPVDRKMAGIHIVGLIGKPLISRGNRNYENYYINGRYVKSAIISKAIEDGYKDFTMQHKYPFTVLHLTMEGSDLDVNVHPTKMELRFSNQQVVYNFVYETITEALREKELIPHIELPEIKIVESNEKSAIKPAIEPYTEPKIVIPINEAPEKLDYFMKKMKERVLSYHNQSSQAEVRNTNEVLQEEHQTARIREAVSYNKEEQQLNFFEEKLLTKAATQEYKLIGQIFGTYWMVEYKDNLYIIDQHAAHERVLYERTINSLKSKEHTSQYISPPIILSLSLQEAQLLEAHIEKFTKIGFEIESFGGDEYSVRAVPDNLFSLAKKDLLIEMLDSLSDVITTTQSPDLILEKIASMSCKAAVKGNSKLSASEMDTLIGELLQLENPYHCPHGRPTIIAMTKKELEKKFKRIV
ncbi:MAG: DNA mismatch repair endonuclease MutL [Lachnospiraceae bacterium]|nr:DNA mismatch repair endonuclease MutL [Lachnospiraceae bacterium]